MASHSGCSTNFRTTGFACMYSNFSRIFFALQTPKSNDYAMARYDISRFGRFLTPDPITGSISDPQVE